jgi:apolipoprotein N-acyltransferase
LSEPKAGFGVPILNIASSWIAGLSGWRRSAFGFMAGAVSVLGFAPFHLWPLLFLTLPSFVWLLDGIASGDDPSAPAKPRWRQAALAGWWFGFGFFIAGLYWLGFAFFVEADKFAWLAPMAVAAFPAALAIFFASASAAAIMLWRPGLRRIFVLGTAFFAVDWLRGHSLTGFPWKLWGYALGGNEALAQSSSIIGIYGLTMLALLIFLSPAALAGPAARGRGRGWVLPAAALGLLVLGWGWGGLRLMAATGETVPGVQLRIVQANVPQAEKWKPKNRKWIFERLRTLSKAPRAAGAAPLTHLIWPETSLPILFMLNERIFVDEVRDALAGLLNDVPTMIIGAERVDGTKRSDGRYNIDRVFNSLFVIGAQARIADIYDKNHLVPFGEYIPFEKTLAAIGIKQLTHMNSGFASGAARRPIATPKAPPFSPLICYEAIFPGRVAGSDGRPGWLLNLTNDAWFGTSTGPYQHLHQTRMRAIEEGLPLIRAANTGISAVIDAHGRIVASLPLNEMGVLDHALPVALPPPPFARWRENCLLLVAFLIFLLYRIVIVVE